MARQVTNMKQLLPLEMETVKDSCRTLVNIIRVQQLPMNSNLIRRHSRRDDPALYGLQVYQAVLESRPASMQPAWCHAHATDNAKNWSAHYNWLITKFANRRSLTIS